jgi:glutamyl-tRNA synthetase
VYRVRDVTSTGDPKPRITRLAPSPTGALHLGNARTFLINWAIARREGMRIILRIEDLDGPRVKAGAIEQTIDLLRWLGIDWDEGPMIQSNDLRPYTDAMERLARSALAYPSELSRTEVESAASAPQEGVHETAFPSSLRPALVSRAFVDGEINWRFAVPPETVSFADGFAGSQSHRVCDTVGDFILWTKRRQPAYQLAVVVDDHRQGVTDIVRGDDLLDSAARQLLLYRALGYQPEPSYTHLPLIRGSDGRRLAKRHGDTRLDTYRAKGVTAERVIGLIGAWCDVVPLPRTLSAADFREAFDLHNLSHDPVTFTPENDRWLLSR